MLLFVISLLLAPGCVPESQVQAPVSKALRQDAEAYAEAQGISLEKAIQRLRMQDPIGELNAVLQERESDVFGGLWIQHQPEYRAIVLVTGDQNRIRRRYIRGSSIEDDVEIRSVTTTLAALYRVQTDLLQHLDKVGSRASTGIDVRENCVSLYVSDPEALLAELEAAGLELPKAVCITPTGPYSEAPPLNAPPGIIFPRQYPPEGLGEEMTALIIGELIEENGCVRVSGNGKSHLIIWPYDHTLIATKDGKLQIRDGRNVAVVNVGDTVQISGGEVPSSTQDLTPVEIPDRCSGPYWLAGSEIKIVKPE